MDEKQLQYAFLSVAGESHPGLTFEEYRDACVFLLFYHYLCLRYDDRLDDCYKTEALVRMAVRGKLQIPSFLRFMEAASPYIRFAGGNFELTEFSFYKSLNKMQSLEKQKSYARFVRKLIKKMVLWENEELLLSMYPSLFRQLTHSFAMMKKETYMPEEMRDIYRLFLSRGEEPVKRIFLPDFEYGLLFPCLSGEGDSPGLFGYEDQDGYREIVRILACMEKVPEQMVHVYGKSEWERRYAQWESVKPDEAFFDRIGIFLPEGVEPGRLAAQTGRCAAVLDKVGSLSKGELPFLLSAACLLGEKGALGAVLPGALLYREGKEAQIRQYLMEDLNCLDAVMLLPDHLFQSAGQKEVFLLLKKDRGRKDIMFFDCTEMDSFGEEQLHTIETAWLERKTIPGFCSSVEPEAIRKNHYNLNFPRYIRKTVRKEPVNLEAKKQRIAQIDQELKEIEERIAMYKRDLEL